MFARPTQNHHNCNILRLRRPYHKDKTDIQTKINVLTLVSAEQQTHNFYAEHGMCYGNCSLRQTYAEIKDVEEEHVNMYESLICPNETMYEKLLLHEFMEVCTYNNCYEDETDESLKIIWEEFLGFELAHLAKAIELFEKHENRDAKDVIGEKLVYPCRFKSQKKYVENVIRNEIDKRLGTDKDYMKKVSLLSRIDDVLLNKYLDAFEKFIGFMNDKNMLFNNGIDKSIEAKTVSAVERISGMVDRALEGGD